MALPRPPISPVVPLNSTITNTENIPCDFSTIELQTKEIERIFLRYNQQSKSLFKRFTDFATKRRYLDFHENLDISVTDPYSANWPLVEKLIFKARGIQVLAFISFIIFMNVFNMMINLFCYFIFYFISRFISHLIF